jgi:hypothetical protein
MVKMLVSAIPTGVDHDDPSEGHHRRDHRHN